MKIWVKIIDKKWSEVWNDENIKVTEWSGQRGQNKK